MGELDLILEKLNEDMSSVQDSLCSGAAKDYAEYQYLCGKIRGLLAAQDKILDLKQRMESMDD